MSQRTPDPREIDVVIQGAIAGRPGDPPHQKLTEQCLASLRQHLPGARLILSTWEGADVTGLDFDELVLSPDPGGQSYLTRGGRKFGFNLNRQIVSTQAGLMQAERPYALKFRTDITLDHAGFLAYWDRHPARAADWQVLQDRVLVTSFFTPNPQRFGRQPFHVSDWATFGRLIDVRQVWAAPLYPEEHLDYYERHPEHAHPHEGARIRYTAEQHIWLSMLRGHQQVACGHQWDYGPHNAHDHHLSLVNNAVVLEPKRFGLRFRKYGMGLLNRLCMYDYADWLALYRQYCDPRAGEEARPSGIKKTAASWLERSPLARKLVDKGDYQYVKRTAWLARRGWW